MKMSSKSSHSVVPPQNSLILNAHWHRWMLLTDPYLFEEGEVFLVEVDPRVGCDCFPSAWPVEAVVGQGGLSDQELHLYRLQRGGHEGKEVSRDRGEESGHRSESDPLV